MMKRVLALVTVAATLAGCGDGGPSRETASVIATTSQTVPRPPVASAGRCPVSVRQTVSRNYAPALGGGPVYPVGFDADAILRIAPPRRYASHEWGGQKVLWVRKPRTPGDIVIRGRRLDRPDAVRFNYGDVPADHLTLPDPKSVSDWVDYPSTTRVRAPGCYAYTVQGPGIREVIVFRILRQT